MNCHSITLRLIAGSIVVALLAAGCSRDTAESHLAAAKASLEKRDAKAAVIHAKGALQKDPNSNEARFLLGRALMESNDYATAIVELDKVRDAGYEYDQVVPLLLRAYMARGKAAEVVELGQKALMKSPAAKAEVLTQVGYAHLALNNRSAALKAFEGALAAKPGYAAPMIAQAKMKLIDDDFSGAMALLDRVVADSPGEVDAIKLQGDMLVAIGRFEKAIESYRKVLTIRPDAPVARASIVYVRILQTKFDEAAKELELLSKLAPNAPQTVLLQAQLAFARKDYVLARELSQKLLQMAPNSAATLQMAGAVEFSLGSLAQAEALLSKALQAAPNDIGTRRWLALTYMGSGRVARAVATLQPILSKISTDPDMLYLAGETYLEYGDYKVAEDLLSRASKLRPEDTQKRTSLAIARLEKGEAAAYAELEKIASVDSGTTADMALIASYMRQGDLDKALKISQRVEKKQPNNALAFNLRGRILMAKKDFAGARKSLEQALAVNPGFFPAAANLATLDVRESKPEAAIKRYEAIVAADGKHSAALLALAQLKSNTRAPLDEVVGLINKAISAAPGDFAPRVMLVNQYLQAKDSKKAIAAAQEALAALPNSPEVTDVLGQAQRAAGEFNQAVTTYNKLATQRPDAVEPYLRLAQLYAEQMDVESAARSLRRALAIKPDLVVAQRGLAALALGAGKDADALSIAREAQRQRPKEAVGYLLEGDIHMAKKAWREAATAFRAGIKNAGSTDLAAKLHHVLVVDRKQSEADAFSASWIKDFPRDMGFRLYLGDAATAKGDFAAAASHYKVMLEVSPNNPSVLNNLAFASAQLKRSADALAYAEKANQIAPNQPAFMDTLGMILLDKGDVARAEELLSKAVLIAPDLSNIRLNYARVLVKAGKKAEARKELEELAKLGDKNPEKADVAALLASL